MNGSAPTAGKLAFESAAMPHVDGLFNLALHMTRNRADAEDLVQDTFLRAYTHFARFKAGTNFKAWIYTILKNLAINRYKRTKRGGINVPLEAIELTHEADRHRHPMADSNLFTDTDIRAALHRLPADYRVAFILFAVEGFTYVEISGIMNCPIGTVMSRLFRARKRLRHDLLRVDARRPVGEPGRGRLKFA